MTRRKKGEETMDNAFQLIVAIVSVIAWPAVIITALVLLRPRGGNGR